MASKIKVSFIITGIGFNPTEISTLIGLKPTKIWRLGETIKPSILKRKHDGWCISTTEKESMDLNEEVLFLLRKIISFKSNILNVCKKFNLSSEIAITVYVENNEIPSLHFNSKVVSIISELNTEIDIDLYIMD